MKTEREIRSHLEVLKLAAKSQCGCAATEHEAECAMGGFMVAAVIDALRWVLGQNEDYERLVERTAAWKSRKGI